MKMLIGRKTILDGELARLSNLAWDVESFTAEREKIARLSVQDLERLLRVLTRRSTDDIFRHRLTAAAHLLGFVNAASRIQLAAQGWVDRVGQPLFELWWHEAARTRAGWVWGFGCNYHDDSRIHHIGAALECLVELKAKVGWSIRWDIDRKGPQSLLRVFDRNAPKKPILDFVASLLDDADDRRNILWPNLRSFYKPDDIAMKAMLTLHRLPTHIAGHHQMQEKVLWRAVRGTDSTCAAIDVLLQHHTLDEVRALVEERHQYHPELKDAFPKDLWRTAAAHRSPSPRYASGLDSTLENVESDTDTRPPLTDEHRRANIAWLEVIIRNRDVERMYQHFTVRCVKFCQENKYKPTEEFWRLLMECFEQHPESDGWFSWNSIWAKPSDWRQGTPSKETMRDVIGPAFMRVLLNPRVEPECKEKVVGCIATLGKEAAVCPELVHFLVDVAVGLKQVDRVCNFTRWNSIRALVHMEEDAITAEDGTLRNELVSKFVNDEGRIIRPVVVSRWYKSLLRDDVLVHAILREVCGKIRMTRGHLYAVELQRPLTLGHRSVDFEEGLDILGQLVRYAGIRVFHVRGKFAWARIGELDTGQGSIRFVDEPLPAPPSREPSDSVTTVNQTTMSTGPEDGNGLAAAGTTSMIFSRAYRYLSVVAAYLADPGAFQDCKIPPERFEARFLDVCQRLGITPSGCDPFRSPLEDCLLALQAECEMALKDNDLVDLQRVCHELSPLIDELQAGEVQNPG